MASGQDKEDGIELLEVTTGDDKKDERDPLLSPPQEVVIDQQVTSSPC